MNYFFVFQNKSYNEESTGRYLWAPKRGEKGQRISHWDMMKQVKKGDIIIHSYNKIIKAISIAKEDCYSSNRPVELSEQWNNDGWRVDAEYYFLNNSIVTSDHMVKLLELQPGFNAPFNKMGRGNTGYLFAATKEMFEYIIKETAKIQTTNEEKGEVLSLIIDSAHVNQEADDNLINSIEDSDLSIIEGGFVYEPEQKEKSPTEFINNLKVYPRDKQTAINALSRAFFKCEIDVNHPTFKRKKINIDYTEPHHLIPMSYLDKFEVSLDVEANIVSLCSNCHNQLHYGRDIEPMLKKLYEERKELLEFAGIEIDYKDLLEMYL
jgi:uncharacterized membrane protein YkoI